MSDIDLAQYGLIVAFPDESASFVHGFEAGTVFERMQSGAVAEIELSTHAENREVIARMGITCGWSVHVTASGVEGWDTTVLRKEKEASKRPNPRGLRVVSFGDGGTDV